MNPLLRKGGVHQRSRSAERSNQHQHLQKMVDEWYTDDELDMEPGDSHLRPDYHPDDI